MNPVVINYCAILIGMIIGKILYVKLIRPKVRQSRTIPKHSTYTITVKDLVENQHLNDRTRILWILKKAGAPIDADGLFLKLPNNYTWSRTDDLRGNMTWTFYGPL